jgi:hypothetical protein
MKSVMLSPTDQNFHLATHKLIIDAADIAALGAATTGVIALVPTTGTFPAGTTFRFAGLHLVTAFDFSDTGITSLLVEVGITGGDTDKYLTSTQIAVDGTEVIYKVEGAVTQPDSENTADSVDALFTVANGGSPLLSECTVGELHLYFYVHAPFTEMRPVLGKL